MGKQTLKLAKTLGTWALTNGEKGREPAEFQRDVKPSNSPGCPLHGHLRLRKVVNKPAELLIKN
jgi:hypothetical protein